jgi:hypothetical protein
MPENSYQDDLTVEDGDGLLRRVPNWPNMVMYDENIKSYRASSACFSDRDGGKRLSVTLERPLFEAGGSHADAIALNPDFGVARLDAGFVRHAVSPPQQITRSPTEDDPYHALMVGEKSKKARKDMAKAAVLVVLPKPD